MSFFPRSLISNIHDASSPSPSPASFHPLFRLLDDFDNYRTNPTTSSPLAAMQTFTPKFDVKEVGEVYELHGELPGIAQKDVEIEFSDDTTITIKGRTEHSYTSGTPPSSGAIEDGKQNKAIEEGSSRKERQPTVEDEDNASANNNQEVAKANGGGKEVAQSREPEAKYWVSERSVGEFARSFTFPVRVDQENVKASMKNGVLSVTVPKAKKTEGKKIVIQ